MPAKSTVRIGLVDEHNTYYHIFDWDRSFDLDWTSKCLRRAGTNQVPVRTVDVSERPDVQVGWTHPPGKQED